MPLEFSVAAFRFGHSMVRGRYDYNISGLDDGTLAEPFAVMHRGLCLAAGRGGRDLKGEWG